MQAHAFRLRLVSIGITLSVLATVQWIPVVEGRRGPRWHQLPSDYSFDQYLQDFGKSYQRGSKEWEERKTLFTRRRDEALRHNADSSMTYKKGINEFSDTSDAERRSFNGGARLSMADAPGNGLYQHEAKSTDLPLSVDYRLNVNPSVLTAVKAQGKCGACWSHAATESVETYYAMLTGELHVLSQQQVLACTNMTDCWTWRGVPMSGGKCEAGAPQRAWDGIRDQGGLHSLWAYPYTEFFHNESDIPHIACRNLTDAHGSWFGRVRPVATVKGYNYVPANNATAAMEVLAHVGPFVTQVAAWEWFDYEAGVFRNNASYGNYNFATDHVVQVVGYGSTSTSESGQPLNYWIVRNTFGARWGEAGYIRLERPAEEPCGVNNDSYKCGVDVNTTVTVCGTSAVLSQPLFPIVGEVDGY